MYAERNTRRVGWILTIVLAAGSVAFGGYVPQGPPWANPVAGPVVPPPGATPGKEYLNAPNMDANGVADAQQVVRWDGAGGTVDGFDYNAYGGNYQADALAAEVDVLYKEAVANTSHLLLSVQGDGGNIYVERAAAAPNVAVWATPAQVQPGVTDVAGLEVWGLEPANPPDALMYSLTGDPQVAWGGGVNARASVFRYNQFTLLSTPIVKTSDIATAIGKPLLASTLDVDALMFFNAVGSGELGDDPNDSMMFSIQPIDVFDGGEIWIWDGNPAHAATFLVHGGHTWNTAFNIMATYGLPSENIDALEAVSTNEEVPEPVSLVITGLGAAVVLLGRRMR